MHPRNHHRIARLCGGLLLLAISAQTAEAQDPARGESPGKQAATATAGNLQRDLVYRTVDGHQLKLDLYLPASQPAKVPVVVWVHGGGWSGGSKNRCPASWLTEHGYAVASIEYRLTDTAIWPAQIEDCRAAIRWLRDHAGQYRLDGENLAVWGGSAGGHLVALLGTLPAPPGETLPAPPHETLPAPPGEKTSSRVQAVIDWYGPADLLTMPANVLSGQKTPEDLAKSNGAKLLGRTVREVPDLAKQASALYQVSPDDPPFLIMHGDADPQVPLDQSQRLHAALQDAGVESELVVLPGAGHGGKEFQSAEARQWIRNFLEMHLTSPPAAPVN